MTKKTKRKRWRVPKLTPDPAWRQKGEDPITKRLREQEERRVAEMARARAAIRKHPVKTG